MMHHPTTGLAYVHVIPAQWGAFVDIRAAYLWHAQSCPWVAVMTPEEFRAERDANAGRYADPATMFVLWQHEEAGPRTASRALITAVYSEAIGDPREMLRPHVESLDRFRVLAQDYDGVFSHTPWMAGELKVAHEESHVLPVGWEPQAAGRPRFETPKHHDLVYYGSNAGKRQLVMPMLKERFGAELYDASGSFGRQVTGLLDTTKASLYIAHSDVLSFSTWRIWQHLPSSAAMIGEPGDMWPMVLGTHYVAIPRVTFANAELVVEELRSIVKHNDLLSYAKALYQDLGPEFTLDRCTERYLVPASESIAVKREKGLL